MYQIAICNDEAFFANHLQNLTENYFQNKKIPVSITVFTDSRQLVSAGLSFDLYFLDIRMPDITGMGLAELVRQIPGNNNSNTSIIFVSSFYGAVFDSIRYTPLRFIRKEMVEEEIVDALEAFLQLQARIKPVFKIEILEKGTSEMIPINQILYVEVQGHYLNVICQDTVHHIRSPLTAYEVLLLEHGFVRIHQGCLVNMSYINIIDANYITLINQTRLHCSRRCRNSVKETYMDWERKQIHVLTV